MKTDYIMDVQSAIGQRAEYECADREVRLLIQMAEHMRHALGINDKKVPYRNHFCGESEALELATKLGFCKKYIHTWCPGPTFVVTPLGAQFIGITDKELEQANK